MATTEDRDRPHIFYGTSERHACTSCHTDLSGVEIDIGERCHSCVRAEDPVILDCVPGGCRIPSCGNYRGYSECTICLQPEGDKRHLDRKSIELPLGAIVRRIPYGSNDREVRGAVTWTPQDAVAFNTAREAGETPKRWPPSTGLGLAVNNYVVSQGRGVTSVTTNTFGEWVVVPYEEMTAEERVTHTAWTFTEPDSGWFDPEEGEELEDLHQRPFALISALLPPKTLEELDDYGECRSNEDAALAVACYIDDLTDMRDEIEAQVKKEYEEKLRVDREKFDEDRKAFDAAVEWYWNAKDVKEMRDDMPLPLMESLVRKEQRHEPF